MLAEVIADLHQPRDAFGIAVVFALPVRGRKTA
jgi:hypothetical protein